MAKLLDSVKALGEKITGEKINGDTLFAAVKDAGEKMTGKEIEGKELNDLIAETAKEYQGGGGTVVVDELPETGEEHTIYELHEQVEPAYNWVAEINILITDGNFSPIQKGGYLLVVETSDDMLEKVNEDTHLQKGTPVFVYLRAEDRMFANLVDAESGNIVRMEFQKNSAYSFELDGTHLYVLKSIHTGEEITEDVQYYGVLYNGNEVELHHNQDKAFILRQVTFDEMDNFNATGYKVYQVSILPTAEEVVANYLDELVACGGNLYFEINGVIKFNDVDSDNYHWVQGLENFYQPWEEGAEPTEIYTGALEWENVEDPVYTEIPYQDLFDSNIRMWFFKPGQGGDEVSYWIYANNTWTNTEDIGKPVEQEVVYGELLEGPNFSTDHKFISPYTNEQICNYLAEGKPVILRYHPKFMGEDQFMYINIYDFNATEMDVEYVNQPLHYDNFTCREYTTTDRIMYNYGSDYFYYELGE